jgi:Rod binding domain-containing protein
LSNPLSALPAVPESALPRAVREGTPEDRRAYQAALGFERVMAEQLLKSMTASQSLAEGPQGPAVQGAMADALIAGGGFGLAEALQKQIREATS